MSKIQKLKEDFNNLEKEVQRLEELMHLLAEKMLKLKNEIPNLESWKDSSEKLPEVEVMK